MTADAQVLDDAATVWAVLTVMVDEHPSPENGEAMRRFRRMLAQAGITEAEIRAHLRWTMRPGLESQNPDGSPE